MKKIFLCVFTILILVNSSSTASFSAETASSEGDILEGATTITPTPQASPSIQGAASCRNPRLWILILAFQSLILASIAKYPPREKRVKILFGIFVTTILCLSIISKYFCSWLLILASGALGLTSLFLSSRKSKKAR